MKKVLTVVVACVLASACSSSSNDKPLEVTDPFRTWGAQFADEAKIAANLQSSSVSPKLPSQLQYQLLSLDRTNRIDVTEKSPVVQFPEGNSYTAALLIPDDISQFTFHLDSLVARTVFVPTAIFYDQGLNEVLRVESTTLDPEGFLSMQQAITPEQAKQARYLLVYSKATEYGGKTELIDPKVVYEEKTGGGLPSAFKYYSKHSPIGNLDVRFSEVLFSSSYVTSAEPKQNLTPVEAAPVKADAAAATAVATTTAVAANKAPSADMLSDTESFYLDQISKAVAQDDLTRALNLVEEAERAGSTKAQSHFMQQLKKQQQQ
ncbi:MalM family protein [Agarivorans sp. 1_MG-2023]|uniref:MalM family protein n=1 Tax=Agarivorans sp. 1_MG-2023 TaxID=3062634 RepID=UPI0026E1F661|nr:MalM family protein [Agarivorans sp. 1_MG-2023]MDO6764872.1 MalM family protein [Agarivorans sp. 1_MG-2023]